MREFLEGIWNAPKGEIMEFLTFIGVGGLIVLIFIVIWFWITWKRL